ncbi:probable serine-tRNA ligase, cytosolic [Rhynchosporium graminicola]|uniref:serine--tRNA ligase n=1 Tax=Rhynchosporium graminicola TaxID=2792576 RepID=A0A1E1L6H9_9HELO|nr:probable serine-tRNA ligase, cytosolic [Rhynchosporium commune]
MVTTNPKQRKIAIVGSRSVGKSSLTVQFVDGHFVESYYPTIENTFSKVIKVKGVEYATEIVDTAGQDEYSILSSKHFIGIHGYIFVYSVASSQSFEMVQVIRDKILNQLGIEWIPCVLVGNKSDLRPDQRQVSVEQGKVLAAKFNCAYTEASARYNENVGKAFEQMIGQIEKVQNPTDTSDGGKCMVIASSAVIPKEDIQIINTTRILCQIPLERTERINIMLDVLDFIKEKGGNPEKIKESQRRRFAPEEVVDEVIALYEDHRATQYSATQINSKINETQKAIAVKRKAKEDAADLMKLKTDLEKEKKSLVDSAAEKDVILRKKIGTIGNYVHDSVTVEQNEDFNSMQRDWAPEGVKVEKRDVLSHHEVLTRLDGYDPERGVKVVGHRGYFLKKWGVFLNQALINYGLEFLDSKGYTPLQTPQFMLKEYMAKTAQLEQFDEELYKVVDGDAQNDKYLIATSEQPISAFHADEWLLSKELPIKYAGFSSCYRREAGSHGRDAWGIFRVHQFEKIEQFILTDPEKSWEMFDEMIAVSEGFYKSLGVPYRVVAIVSGALNNAAAKKYDLEAWFPFQGEYKELVSCSNCTDYQSRALEIRYGAKLQTEIRKKYVHALNSTLCATERALCCLLENFQTEDGFNVPEPLRKYIPGAVDFIPFTKDLPKDSTSQKTKGKGEKVPAPAPKPKVAPATPAEAEEKLKDLKV